MHECCPHLIVKHKDAPWGDTQAPPGLARCYVCDRMTHLSSLGWHLKACGRRWIHMQADGRPEELRRHLPEPPLLPLPLTTGRAEGEAEGAESALERYNNEAHRIHLAEVQPHCPFCGEGSENDELLEKHMTTCCPEVLKELQAAVQPQERQPARHPANDGEVKKLGAQCHLCGQRYGLAGFPWHLPSCYRMWRAREGLKPPEFRRFMVLRAEVRIESATLPGASEGSEIDEGSRDVVHGSLAAWITAFARVCDVSPHQVYVTRRRPCTTGAGAAGGGEAGGGEAGGGEAGSQDLVLTVEVRELRRHESVDAVIKLLAAAAVSAKGPNKGRSSWAVAARVHRAA